MKGIIKVAIQVGYGEFKLPTEVLSTLQKYPIGEARVHLAEYLEKRSVDHNWCEPQKPGYTHIIGSNKYFYVPEDGGSPREYEIVEVDTSLPWWISRSVCGDETIEYVQIKTDPFNYYLSGIPEQKVIS